MKNNRLKDRPLRNENQKDRRCEDRHRKDLGKRSEDAAADFLVKKGMQILARNFRSGPKELDIIAAEPLPDFGAMSGEGLDESLDAGTQEISGPKGASRIPAVNAAKGNGPWEKGGAGFCNIRIVEVKARQEPLEAEPWESVRSAKRENMFRAAEGYIHCDRFRKSGIRYSEIFFDVVSIVWDENGNAYKLDYIPDAFRIIRT